METCFTWTNLTRCAPVLEYLCEQCLHPAGTSRPQGEGLGSARSTPSRSAPEDAKRKAETLSLKTSGVGCLVKELWPEVLPSMLQALRDHNAVLCDHPHARDYSLLEVRSSVAGLAVLWWCPSSTSAEGGLAQGDFAQCIGTVQCRETP